MNPASIGRRRPWLSPLLGVFLILLSGTGAAAASEPAAVSKEVSLRGLQVRPDETGRWTEVELPGAVPLVALGQPALPTLRLSIDVPAAAGVLGVRAEVLEEERVGITSPVRPYAGEVSSQQESPPPAAPDAEIYASDAFFPSTTAELVTVAERSDGTRYAIVEVHPVRYRAAAGELRWARRIRVWVDLIAGSSPAPGVLRRERLALTATPPGPGEGTGGRVLLVEQGFAPRELPSTEGTPVEYVIISPPDPQMMTEWQRLADWKTATGHPALVVSTDWIDANYPNGCDLPERMRFFIRDAYIHWGLRWVLVGADPDVIPIRYVRSWGLDRDLGRDIPSDYYLACLDGTWDADRDGIFGESAIGITGADTLLYESDNVDFVPDVQVGRVTARDAAGVDAYLDKYFTFVQNPPASGYLDRDLFLGEVLFDAEWKRYGRPGGLADCDAEDCFSDPTCRVNAQTGAPICARTDGATYCFRAEEAILATDCPHELVFLLERKEYWAAHEPIHATPDVLSATTALDYLEDGYQFVHHVGHADRDRWAVGGTSAANERLRLQELASLRNGDHDHYFIAYGVNCSSAAIDYDSFADELIMKPGQGAVGYIGATDADFPSMADGFARSFYSYLFAQPGGTIGDGHFLAMATNTMTGANAHRDGTQRFLLFTLVLLGDPGLAVWWQTPRSMSVAYDTQVELGSSPLVVTVTSQGAPVSGARVCVRKADEIYAVALTGANGQARIPFVARTTGQFQIAITSARHYPFTGNGQVVAAGSAVALVADPLQLIDDGSAGSEGNDSGSAEEGERIRLPLTVRNRGGLAANYVQARLALGGDAPAGALEFIDSTATIGPLGAAQSGTDGEAFLLEIGARLGTDYFGDGTMFRVPLVLTLQSGKAEFSSDFTLEIARPRIAVALNAREDPQSGRVRLRLGLENQGKGASPALVGVLTPVGHVSVIGDRERAIAGIAPGDTTLAGPFELQVSNEALATLNFAVVDRSLDPPDTLHRRIVDLRPPNAPARAQARGLSGSVELTWDEALDPGARPVSGYRVHRAPAGSGVFEPLFEGLLADHRFLRDAGLAQLTQYRYLIQAVDAGGLAGHFSDTVSVYTSPPVLDGWPNRLAALADASPSPLVCELDGAWSTRREVVFGGDLMYAFHGDGSEVVDGDEVGSSFGPFSNKGCGFWGKAACGDLDANGVNELVAVVKSGQDCRGERGELVCWEAGGRQPKWSVDLHSAPIRSPIAWFSPTLADWDQNDGGKLEVILCAGAAGAAGIYAFNHDGTPMIAGTSGLVRDLKGRDLYHSPAVGDVDGDGAPEVVMTTRTSDAVRRGAVWVVNADGTSLAGFEDGLYFEELGLAQQTTASPTLYDVDADGRDDIFAVTPLRLWSLDGNGAVRWYWPFTAAFDVGDAGRGTLSEPALGDIDGDGTPEVAIVDEGERLWAINAASGQPLANFPVDLRRAVGTKYGSCVIANVDTDSLPEIVFGDNDKHIHAYRRDGTPARGFPIYFGGAFLKQSPALWDVDKDGEQNLIVQAEDNLTISIYDLEGAPADSVETWRTNPWPMRYRDDRNTGRYRTEGPVGIRVTLNAPTVDRDGGVTLEWICGQRVAAFEVQRSEAGSGSWQRVGTVDGRGEGDSPVYSFRDRPPSSGTYIYRIDSLLLNGQTERGPTVAVPVRLGAARRLAIERVVPRPLASGALATIAFSLPGSGSERVAAELTITDIQGRRVRTLLTGLSVTGVRSAYWDGRDDAGRSLASGLYLINLESRGASASERLLLVR